MSESTQWDQEVDVLVVGSGGGGMTASIRAHDLGANTLVIEKTEKYGGTTSMSGGVIWVPNTHLMKAKGLQDSEEEGFKYLKHLIGDAVPNERIRAYVQNAPKMVQWVDDNTHLKFESLDIYPDYYPDAPGYKEGGRSHDPKAFNAKALGKDFENQRGQHPQTLIFDRFTMETMEFRKVFKQEKGWMGLMFRVVLQYIA